MWGCSGRLWFCAPLPPHGVLSTAPAAGRGSSTTTCHARCAHPQYHCCSGSRCHTIVGRSMRAVCSCVCVVAHKFSLRHSLRDGWFYVWMSKKEAQRHTVHFGVAGEVLTWLFVERGHQRPPHNSHCVLRGRSYLYCSAPQVDHPLSGGFRLAVPMTAVEGIGHIGLRTHPFGP